MALRLQLKNPVEVYSALAQLLREWQQTTLYGKPTDWVLASRRTHGKTPRVGNMPVSDHLRPAAIKAGVILKQGQRFGFHNLRHSLSTLLITGKKADVRTDAGHYAAQQFLNNNRALYTIVNGNEDRGSGASAQHNSRSAD